MTKVEQAAEDCFGKSGSMCNARLGFIEGAIWQAERDKLSAYDIAEIHAAIQAKQLLQKFPYKTEMQIYEEVAREYNEKRDYAK